MTSFGDQLFQFGNVPVGVNFPTGGNTYYLDPANGSDDNDGLAINRAFKTLPVAYAKLTANQNDILYYLAGASSLSLSAAFTWGKSYTHFIGVCAPTQVAQRARVFQTSTATGLSPLITISASGCIWKNLYIFQGVNDNTSLINVSITGGRNYFDTVHFAGGGHATQAVDGGASLKLDGAEENTFKNCTIGVDTISAGTGMAGILFDTDATRNLFIDCTVRLFADNAGAIFVEVADGTGIAMDNTFKNCLFLNNSVTSLTAGFALPAGLGAQRRILLKDCMTLGATKLDANDRGALYGNMNAVTGADLSGAAVELIS